MKREILFRGFCPDEKGTQIAVVNGKEYKGDWVEGFYFNMHHNDKRLHIHHFIIPNNTPIPKERPIGEIQVEVIPETVGQFTGLTDKNGKKIFEGDRVLGDIGNGYIPVVRLLNRIGIVEYIDYAFLLKIINRFGINEKEKVDFCNTFVSLGAFGNKVIIGTKYDDCLYKTQDGHCIRESDNTVYAYCVEGPCDEIIGNKWEE